MRNVPPEISKFRRKIKKSAGKLNFQREIQIFRWKNKTSAGNLKILRIFKFSSGSHWRLASHLRQELNTGNDSSIEAFRCGRGLAREPTACDPQAR
jgi:hypothetical protein